MNVVNNFRLLILFLSCPTSFAKRIILVLNSKISPTTNFPLPHDCFCPHHYLRNVPYYLLLLQVTTTTTMITTEFRNLALPRLMIYAFPAFEWKKKKANLQKKTSISSSMLCLNITSAKLTMMFRSFEFLREWVQIMMSSNNKFPGNFEQYKIHYYCLC